MFSSTKFGDFITMTAQLNGGIVGNCIDRGVQGLIGLTLTFARPSFSCTFTQPVGWDQPYLLLQHIKAQIEAADPNIKVTAVNGRIAFLEKVPTNGVALDPAADEQARTLLGFSHTGICEGRVINPILSASAPRIESVQQTHDGSFLVLIWEG